MDTPKQQPDKSRRWFFSLLLSNEDKTEKVKMLTADGKLVSIDKKVLEAAAKKQKASNKEIYDWMENPSKDNS